MNEQKNNGWICLHRAFRDWQHYSEPYVKAVFIDLLLNANHKDGWWHGHKCERGATFTSIRTIAENNNIAINTVQRALRILESTGEIKRVKIDQKHTKTIIRKYSQYQDINISCVSLSNTQSDTQSNTQGDTKQQYNNNNNIVDVDNVRTHEKIVNEFMAQGIAVENFCRDNRIDVNLCRQLADEVVTEWELTGKINNHRNMTDERTHLISQMRIKAQEKRKAQNSQTATDKRKAWEEDLMQGAMRTINEIYNKN